MGGVPASALDEPVETGVSMFSWYNCFSYSRSCPRKLKLGEMVARLDFRYLHKKKTQKIV